MRGQQNIKKKTKEIVNHMEIIWFHAGNEGKNTNIHSDLRENVRRSRKQTKIK